MGKTTLRVKAFFGRNEFLRHVLALMTGTALAQVIVMALMPLLSRIYTDEQFGILAAFTSVVAIITVIVTMRYDMAIMLPEEDRDAIVLKRTVTILALVLGVIATLIMLLLAPVVARLFNTPEVAPWLVVAGVSAFTLAEISTLVYWLNRKSRYVDISRNRVLQSASTAVSQIVLGLTKLFGAGGLILGAIIGQAISIVGLMSKTPELRERSRPTRADRIRLLKRYRKMPLLNLPNALIEVLRMNGINLLIATVSISTLGQFSMAWRMVEVPAALISSALAQVFFQRLSVIKPGNMVREVRNSVLRSAAFGVVPFALVYFLSPWLFPFVFGEQWAQSGVFAQFLVPWLFMNLVTSPISTIFVVLEKQHIALIHSVVYLVVPLIILWSFAEDIGSGIFFMSLAMAAMLIVYVGLSWWVARRFDRSGIEMEAGG